MLVLGFLNGSDDAFGFETFNVLNGHAQFSLENFVIVLSQSRA
jgi:hypothetical protein